MKTKTLVAAMCVLFCTRAVATSHSSVDTIGAVHAKENGEVYVYLSAGESAESEALSCTNDYPYIFDGKTEEGQVLLSTAMFAFASEKKVRVYISACLSGKPKVSRINVYK